MPKKNVGLFSLFFACVGVVFASTNSAYTEQWCRSNFSRRSQIKAVNYSDGIYGPARCISNGTIKFSYPWWHIDGIVAGYGYCSEGSGGVTCECRQVYPYTSADTYSPIKTQGTDCNTAGVSLVIDTLENCYKRCAHLCAATFPESKLNTIYEDDYDYLQGAKYQPMI